MNTDAVELDKLMARLTHSCEQTRNGARQEIQSWPFETVLEILARHWPEGYDLPRPEPASRWERFCRRWSPPEDPPLISAILDTIVIFYAQTTTQPLMVCLALSVLARMEERERKFASRSPGEHRSGAIMIHFHDYLDPQDSFASRIQKNPTHPAVNRLLLALSRLAPLVTPQNCALSPRQCDALLMPLKYPYRDVTLTLNILVLLSWLGEKRHIPAIEAVQRGAIGTDNGRRIHAAATACLEQIRARQDKSRQAQSLLRPAAIETLFAEETLLRPVSATAADPADELLRPSKG